ncbi:LacI family DNA-binding transcriptional regulator [Nonomuraea turcica]|uniref:LacI family DNA-binding transcriptional regulator n=1 Tax=Nonomuraea sp. G32 TaxID=3067274 RepID=UPI00273BCA27|nr:LacI family DNA-binding transcriptional regulator [Nonomuraea sp. G32]MDP4502587.1 LacI family DNA-binding transcriptional regulator [Nonomuraea sp. G32]
MPKRAGPRRPTQVEIAQRAGVSQATVSLVLSERPGVQVAEETRRRVQQAIEDLGYAVNPAARALRGMTVKTIGLYTFESVFPVDQRDFYHPFLVGVEEEAARLGYDLLLFTSANTAQGGVYARGRNALLKADGCVLLGRHISRDDLANLVKEGFPFVFIGRRDIEGTELSYVAPDYVAPTAALVEELVALGHQRILLLRQTDGAEPGDDRELGLRQGAQAAGLSPDDLVVEFSSGAEDIGADRVTGWVRAGITAVLVEPSEDNATGLALAEVAEAAGLRIPDDLSVAFLGSAPAPTATRIWTSFEIPRVEMGRAAVQLLVNLLEGGDQPPLQLVVPCTDVRGNSISRVVRR